MNRLILTLVFVLMSAIMLVAVLFTDLEMILALSILGGVWVLYLILFFYLAAAYKNYSYIMDDRGFYINSGVIWKNKIVVPRNRVQHTDISQGPLDRQYDLAELTIHTAGTRSASVKLLGLYRQQAEDLRESLSFEISDDVV